MAETAELPLLAPPQLRMWFLEQLEPGHPEANLFSGFRIKGALDPLVWEKAVKQTVAANPFLHTRFEEVRGLGVRQIAEPGNRESGVVWETLAGASRAEWEQAWMERVPQMARIPFALGRLPLFRLHLAKLGPDEHALLLVMHHIVSDGDLSAELFLRQIVSRYGARGDADTATVATLVTSASPPASADDDALGFWREYLDDAPQEIVLPRSTGDGTRSAVPLAIPTDSISRLGTLAAEEGGSLFDVLLTAFGLLLKGHTRQDDILIGWPDPGREKTNDQIGYFGNPLPIRFTAPDQSSFRQLIATTRQSVRSAQAHAQTPFEKIVQAVAGPVKARRPLFQTMFDLQPAGSAIEGAGLTLQPEWWDARMTEYEWSLFLRETAGGGVEGRLEFRPENYSADEMEKVVTRYLLLLERFAADPDAVASLPLTADDRAQLAQQEYGDVAALPDLCAHELFEAQVRLTPDAIALEYRGETRTYRELNEDANRLARHLVGQGIGPEVMVALCVERSIAAVTVLLAIWKAGGAFLPLDPAYPSERLAFMLQDCRARILLTQPKFLPALPVDDGFQILLCDDLAKAAQGEAADDLERRARHDQLNYIIYTSGSTGVPKGIAMVHRCLVNIVTWQLRYSPLRTELRTLQFASLNFDICFQEMFTTWGGGGTVVLIDEDTRRDPVALLDYLCAHRINRLFLPFVALQQLALAAQDGLAPPSTLREVITAGEQLRTTPALRAFFQRLPGCSLQNQYGPSEAHVITNHDLARNPDAWPALPPVGQPLLNTRIVLVDGNLQPVPPGAPGEVLVGGAGLARGYQHRPEVTAEKFLSLSFTDEPAATFYRTGDLARCLPDGSLEFLRRIDHQVKVRGFRIELGEVEAIIGQCPEVRETVVLALGEAGSSQLAAYVVPEPTAQGGHHDEARQVSNWQTLWEDTYRNAPDSDFNLAGWTSSYTGQPLPAAEMRAWRDQTVTRILALKPRRVLEIGCGSGLLLAGVAPHCEFYAGTDFSAAIIERLAARVQADPTLASRVRVRPAEALDLDAWTGQSFDTIVLNSVLQLFPSGDYLERVLAKAARLLAPGGHLFVGDVQNLDLLDAYHAGVQFYRSPENDRMQEIARRWRATLAREDQLMVAPAFFARLPASVPEIVAVALNLKRGRHGNELERFRYDVVLTVGQLRPVSDRPKPCEVASLAEVERCLRADPQTPVCVKGLPNARVAFDRQLLSGLESNATKADVLAASAPGADSVDPEDCWALAEKLGVHCSVGWSRQPGAFDALWSSEPDEHLTVSAVSGQPLTNDPSATNRRRAFAEFLRSYLEEKLPEYMVPNHLIVLDALPVKTNGKVDRAMLPAPETFHTGTESAWVGPATELERALAALWEETLDVTHAGMDDDFFKQGGHSLLAVQLLHRVRQQFDVQIPLITLFEERTLKQLARHIAAAQKIADPTAGSALEEGVL